MVRRLYDSGKASSQHGSPERHPEFLQLDSARSVILDKINHSLGKPTRKIKRMIKRLEGENDKRQLMSSQIEEYMDSQRRKHVLENDPQLNFIEKKERI